MERSPRLTDFGICSVTKNINSVNASTPNHGCTARYCAPEVLDVEGAREKKKLTAKSDVYSLSMVVVEVCLFPKVCVSPSSEYLRFQLATGKMPFPELLDIAVVAKVSKGKWPRKPNPFEVPGMPQAVWRIAEKCWHEKAKERPEVNTVLQDLENIASTGKCTHAACLCLPWGLINPGVGVGNKRTSFSLGQIWCGVFPN